ncbi:T9SS-dependent M36 family metallopeptidase [Hymenobacter sp. BT491]|uniref:T9SS-dependent M36 family metallopeptidase n=1 Tax=Hymenobacter sp. BT491 TaxID=2766779 RepID=UPI001653D015|nr:T9SS-dependent M36 family metallopeptidase [Hymenobacter sp. BT491]MBC6991014.1 T9SS-dependent M36 family metallopeptidase [Hymenobacter sp. BT491]
MPLNFTTARYRALALAMLLSWPLATQAQDASVQRAIRYLESKRAALGLTEADVRDPFVTDSYTDAHNGVSHVYLRQRYQGLEVIGTEMNLNFDRNGNLLSQGGKFQPNLAQAVRSTSAALTAQDATASAARSVGLAPSALRQAQPATANRGPVLSDPTISAREIPTKQVYILQPNGQVKLAWDVAFMPPGGDHYWNMQVDAGTGAVLNKNDWTTQEKAPTLSLKAAYNGTPWLQGAPAALGDDTPAKPAATATYNVYPIPVESPTYGARSVLTSPASAAASPFGWHDIDGGSGPKYTITRGNNVYAYEDRAGQNKAGYSPDGGASLNFNFALDNTKSPLINQDANITNLFYINNIMHDVSFQYGFDEVSGNFQFKNYTDKGLADDDVQAEAQDGGGVRNANFSAPPDNYNPVMQMYIWPRPAIADLTVTQPSTIAGSYVGVQAEFGKSFPTTTPIAGNLVLANDGTNTPNSGCATFTNVAEITGNIAVVDRTSSCKYTDQVKNAQAAGATAVIIVCNEPDVLYYVTGARTDTAGIKIPSMMIYQADGQKIKNQLTAGTPVKGSVLFRSQAAARDGDLDNGIMAHEYTHGISIRLTGGPANSSCLNNKEQMGEGWSDFVGLWMTTRPTDKGETGRAVGNYVLAAPTTGTGIRNKLYSTDFSINNHTYAEVGPVYTETHDVGEVWASVLWDLNWAMIGRYGYDADLYKGTGGNNKTMQLVIDGMKLQPCKPGFLDGRDAILKADQADYGGANQALIWRVFARRGMGSDAVQGSSDDLNDNKAGFAEPAALATKTALDESSLELYPNPANNELTIRSFARSASPVQITVLTAMGRTVSSTTVSATKASQDGVRVNTQDLAAGVYIVRLTTSEGSVTRKLVVQH